MAQPFLSSAIDWPMMKMIGMGQVAGLELVLGFGDNDDVGTAREDVWTAGGVIVHPTSAIAASVVSTDADDTVLGAGGQTVTVTGLDADWNVVSEVVDMAGLTPAVTTQTFIRINGAVLSSAGATGWNEGDITVSLNSNVQRTVEAQEGASHDVHYSVPAGHTLYVVEASAWQAKDFSAETGIYTRGFEGPWVSLGHFNNYRTQVQIEAHAAPSVPAKGDIKFMSTSSGPGAACFVYWVGILRRV